MSSLIFFGIVRFRRLINPKISHLQQIGECDTSRRVQGEGILNEVGYAIALFNEPQRTQRKRERCLWRASPTHGEDFAGDRRLEFHYN
ncbi:MAG: hypothetical protein RM347_026505 [Nostoc sp. ChiQUE02]|uniref:hypothetical protein n=1 Tax=Nostoc sp. ChiQUE02 TaxID=3075377 RepID=UPI002AD439A7|nr:hypothetical protein [Nostoc sp. ChiQUE02]MDZ8234738.1 hypothetical protein [Nostoc sp. ChiQUE02]